MALADKTTPQEHRATAVLPASAGDVAQMAGVSRSQVSNFFNHPDLVSSVTARRIQAAVESLGYVRNASARQLRLGISRTVGLMLLDAWSPYSALVSTGVEDELDRRGWTLHFTNTRRDEARELRHLAYFESWHVSGIIVIPQSPLTGRLEQLARRGIMPVLLDPPATHPVPAPISSVRVDHRHGGRLAAQHVVAQGGRNFAFVGNPDKVGHSADRWAGFSGALADLGMPAPRLFTTAGMEVGDGTAAAQRLLSMTDGPDVDAVFCANDSIALGVLNALLSSGLKVPEDVRIVGYDDLPVASQLAVPLTTVRQPAWQLGATAAAMVVDAIEGSQPFDRHVILQPELVVRGTA